MTTEPALSRRLLLGGSLAAALLAGLTGCSEDEQPSPSPEPDAAAFPAEVEHVYGTTTVPGPPQRVVVVGYTEQDTLLALGVVPVATTLWLGEAPFNVFPWAADRLGEAKPVVLDSASGLPLEQIKELTPDLIVGTTAGLTREQWTELSAIAPTLANSGVSGNDSIEPWPTQTEMIGQALGRSGQAKRLVEELTQRFADARVAHPQFEGVTAAFVQAPYDDGSVIALPPGLNTDFLTDLGLTVPASLDRFVDDDVAQAQIPAEDTGVLDDARVLIWGTSEESEAATLQADPVLGRLDAVRENRSIYTGDTLTSAIYFATVLSLPYVLDQLLPELERVLPA